MKRGHRKVGDTDGPPPFTPFSQLAVAPSRPTQSQPVVKPQKGTKSALATKDSNKSNQSDSQRHQDKGRASTNNSTSVQNSHFSSNPSAKEQKKSYLGSQQGRDNGDRQGRKEKEFDPPSSSHQTRDSSHVQGRRSAKDDLPVRKQAVGKEQARTTSNGSQFGSALDKQRETRGTQKSTGGKHEQVSSSFKQRHEEERGQDRPMVEKRTSANDGYSRREKIPTSAKTTSTCTETRDRYDEKGGPHPKESQSKKQHNYKDAQSQKSQPYDRDEHHHMDRHGAKRLEHGRDPPYQKGKEKQTFLDKHGAEMPYYQQKQERRPYQQLPQHPNSQIRTQSYRQQHKEVHGESFRGYREDRNQYYDQRSSREEQYHGERLHSSQNRLVFDGRHPRQMASEHAHGHYIGSEYGHDDYLSDPYYYEDEYEHGAKWDSHYWKRGYQGQTGMGAPGRQSGSRGQAREHYSRPIGESKIPLSQSVPLPTPSMQEDYNWQTHLSGQSSIPFSAKKIS